MDPAVLEPDDPPEEDRQESPDESQLWEIAHRLERHPEECWHALEGLARVAREVRLSIIEAMPALDPGPVAMRLLRLLSAARDHATRRAARAAVRRIACAPRDSHGGLTIASSAHGEFRGFAAGGFDLFEDRSDLVTAVARRPRLAGSLVTPVDGRGLGSIVISVTAREQRRTAAFLCDVRRGLRDVVGEVEPESRRAGSLIDAVAQETERGYVRDAHALALGLLAGCLQLCGPAVPPPVHDWLDGTLGPDLQPAGFPGTIAGADGLAISGEQIPECASAVLDACPSWLDVSPLTFELAEEIWLREGRTEADPDRDVGAYRFLFEHRLSHRLELFRRTLLWMAWLWKFSGDLGLTQSALALACQLSDEQYAVPSHPFTVELTTRSLQAAQARLRSGADPRLSRRS